MNPVGLERPADISLANYFFVAALGAILLPLDVKEFSSNQKVVVNTQANFQEVTRTIRMAGWGI